MPATSARRAALTTTALLACLAALLVVPLAASAVKPTATRPPHATTGKVSHVRGESGQLEGTVNPRGQASSYYFQYGPTIAYGTTTPTTPVAYGTTPVKVGQVVFGLKLGMHYRIVAVNSAGQQGFGADRVYTPAKGTTTIEIPKEEHVDVYGSPFLFSGRLTGTEAAGRRVVLQSSPYPFLTPFVTVSAPAITNASGAFSFRIINLFQSSQLRVITQDLRPIYSPVITEHVAVRVTFHMRSGGHAGLVRLYGTVTPALSGARVAFQLAKAVRPGKSEREVGFATQFKTKVVRGTRTFSRFSMVVRVRRQGNYRALVEPRPGPLVAGSSPHLLLHAAPKLKR